MQARMKIRHRASRFGTHMLEPREIIATDGDAGTQVSPKEMAHHLNVGNAEAIGAKAETAKLPGLETAKLPDPETVTAPAPETGAPTPATTPKKAEQPKRKTRGRRKPK